MLKSSLQHAAFRKLSSGSVHLDLMLLSHHSNNMVKTFHLWAGYLRRPPNPFHNAFSWFGHRGYVMLPWLLLHTHAHITWFNFTLFEQDSRGGNEHWNLHPVRGACSSVTPVSTTQSLSSPITTFTKIFLSRVTFKSSLCSLGVNTT